MHSAAFTTSDRSGYSFRKKQQRFWCFLSSPHISITVSSLLYGLPQYLYDRLYRVLNAAARVVCLVPAWCINPCMQKHHPRSLAFFQAGRYSLCYDSLDLLLIPRTMLKTLSDKAFAKAGLFLWNELFVDIRRAASVEASWRFSSSGKHLAVNIFGTDLWLYTFPFWFF